MNPVLPTTLTFTVTGSNEEEIRNRIMAKLESYTGQADPVYSSIKVETCDKSARDGYGNTAVPMWEADVRVVLP
jgi:hypothetical protein